MRTTEATFVDTPTPDTSSTDQEVIVRADWERTMSELATQPGTTIKVPRVKGLKREQVVDAFLDAFQLIGGTPRLAMWADENPSDFFKLYARIMPAQSKNETEMSGGLRVEHVLPRGPLDE